MSRDKQIEEMAKDLCDIDCKGMKCNVCDSYGCEYRMQAEALYNGGYRKASDVAREIFEEIEKAISSLEYKASYPHSHIPIETMTAICNWILHECVPSRLAELKKEIHGG